MQKFKKQNGITLIALIITIIVMLILVGISVSTAINGGLFDIAERAVNRTQIEIDKEELLTAVVVSMRNKGEVDFNYLNKNLPEGWSETNGIYTSKKGNEYTVNIKGEITYNSNNSEEEPVDFDWEDVKLRVDTEIYYENTDMDIILVFSNNGELKLKNAGTEEICRIDAKEKVEEGKIDCEEIVYGQSKNIKVSMNDSDENDEKVYVEIEGFGTFPFSKVAYDNVNVYSNKEVLKRLGITNYTGEYKGTWTVLGTKDGKTKLVSTMDVADYSLGYEDPGAIEAISTVGIEPTETEKLERAIWSYKNAVKGEQTLNAIAKEATGIASARSIHIGDIYEILGEENIVKENEEYRTAYGTEYYYYYNTEKRKVYSKYNTSTVEGGNPVWSTPDDTGFDSQIFINEAGNEVIVDSEEDNIPLTSNSYYYNLTDEQKTEAGCLSSGYYWLASYDLECSDDYAYFNLKEMRVGTISSATLFVSNGWVENFTTGVRAIITF